MNYGYYLGAAGVLTALHRQDVATNNLANIQTVGFKPDAAFTIPRQAVRQEDNLMSLPSNTLLERLGGGVLLAPSRTNFKQGALTPSRNPFDLAIEGEGFLAVAGTKGGGGGAGNAAGDQIRLTRDGRLTTNAERKLVTVNDGREVLDDAGRPITLDPALDFKVNEDGTVLQGGQPIATLGFYEVPNKGSLRKVGDNLYGITAAGIASKVTATGRIRQQNIEESAADPIRAMMAVQSAADAVGTTSKIMQIHDDLMNRAINTLGRVTA